MEPNQPPVPQPPTNPVEGQPVVDSQPTPPSAPVSPTPPAPIYAPASGVAATKKSRKGLFAGLGIGAAVLLIFGSILLFMTFTGVQVRAASTAFMAAATKAQSKDDLNILFNIAQADDDSSKQFLTSAADSVHGNYSLKDSKIDAGAKSYFLYNLTNAKVKYARTTVEKKSGHYVVTDFVFSSSVLGLVPGNSTGTNQTSQTTPAASDTTKTTAPVCLVDSDLTPLNNAGPNDQGFGTTFETEGYRQYVVDTYFFQPDSTAYAYPDQMPGNLAKVKTFYETNKAKQFTIHLSGKVKEATSTAVGVKLANDRANKIKSELIALGVSTDKIVIDEPQHYTSAYSDGSERNVDLTVRTNVPCTNTPSSSGANR